MRVLSEPRVYATHVEAVLAREGASHLARHEVAQADGAGGRFPFSAPPDPLGIARLALRPG